MNFVKWIIKNMIGEVTTDRLIRRGMVVGENFSRQGNCFIDPSHCWLIIIGSNVTLSRNVTILAHDASTSKHTGYTKIAKTVIENDCFLGINSTVLPGVRVAHGCIIGASSVVTRDTEPNGVYAGNPAEYIMSTEEFAKKHIIEQKTSPLFDESYKFKYCLPSQKKEEMLMKLGDKHGYIR